VIFGLKMYHLATLIVSDCRPNIIRSAFMREKRLWTAFKVCSSASLTVHFSWCSAQNKSWSEWIKASFSLCNVSGTESLFWEPNCRELSRIKQTLSSLQGPLLSGWPDWANFWAIVCGFCSKIIYVA
jgi:hypothetical protein